MRAFGVENRRSDTVLPRPQSAFEEMGSPTGGSRPPILRLQSDKAKEFLSRCDPAGNGLAERWVGIIKVRATALLADVRLTPEYWSHACCWVAYVHTHRVTEIPIGKSPPKLWRRSRGPPGSEEAPIISN